MTSIWKVLALLSRATALASMGMVLSSCAVKQPESPAHEIAIGDSVDHVRQMLGVTTPLPLTPIRSTTPGAQSLSLRDRGVMVFFDSENKVYEMRLDAPFATTIFGARIGEPRQEIIAALGPPAKILPTEHIAASVGYIYNFKPTASVRYDFGRQPLESPPINHEQPGGISV
jgi:hypothetical protein